MLVEAFVFCRQNGLLHQLRGVFDAGKRPPLFAKFTNLDAVCRKDPQRDFGTVVGQDF